MSVENQSPNSINPFIMTTAIKHAPKGSKLSDVLVNYNLSPVKLDIIKIGLQNANLINFERGGIYSIEDKEDFSSKAVAEVIGKYSKISTYVSTSALVNVINMIPTYWVESHEILQLYLQEYPDKSKKDFNTTLNALIKLEKLEKGKSGTYRKRGDFEWEEVQTLDQDYYLEIMSKEYPQLPEVKSEPKPEKLPTGKSEENILQALVKLRKAGKIKYSLVSYLRDNGCSYVAHVTKKLLEEGYIFKHDSGHIEWNKSFHDVSLVNLANKYAAEYKTTQNRRRKITKDKPKKSENVTSSIGQVTSQEGIPQTLEFPNPEMVNKVNIRDFKNEKEYQELLDLNEIKRIEMARVQKDDLFDLISEIIVEPNTMNNSKIQMKVRNLLKNGNLTHEFKTHLMENKFGYLD